jgi:iron complex outermembrane recepter protein
MGSTIKTLMRSALALALSFQLHAQSTPSEFNLPAQPLAESLKALATVTDVNVLFDTAEISTRIAPPLRGSVTVNEALTTLLAGSGLQPRYLDEKTVVLEKVKDSSVNSSSLFPHAESGVLLAQAEASSARSQEDAEGEKAPASSAGSPGVALEEVVVTAQKRTERLQDVPAPVTAISGDALVDGNQLRLASYFDKIPGFSLSPGPRGEAFLSIRGINTNGAGNPNVGVLIDDVPFGSTRSSGGGGLTPDLDPSQLARVEVLRGPQGTLYGASSMGGLLKYVTIDPSTAGFTGRIHGDLNAVGNGETGYGVRASVNIPAGESLAVSASGFGRHDPGYIDDPVLGINDINGADAGGGRVAALWRPSESFSVKIAALLQNYDRDGSPEIHVNPVLADLEQNSVIGAGRFENDMDFYSATVKAEFGGVSVTAVSGYNIVENDSTIDFVGLRAPSLALFQVAGALFFDRNETEKFSQEVRFDIPLAEKVEWLVGGFYTDEKSKWFQHIDAIDPTVGTVRGRWYDVDLRDTLTEYAAFTNFVFHVTDRLDVQLGGRHSQNKQTYSLAEFGPLVGGQNVTPQSESDESSFTYLATARYTLHSSLMVYTRLASGYRPGGPNRDFPGDVVPLEYEPDTTRSYEIGTKGSIFAGALSFDVAAYYIDWRDIQYNGRVGGFGYLANGGDAKSQGVELAVTQRPWTGMTLTGWVAYNDAQLTTPFPTGTTSFGVTGNRLPYVSRWSGNLSAEQEFPLTSNMRGLFGASVTHVGDRLGIFQPTALRQDFPAYTSVDVHAGVRRDSWSVNMFANNVGDKRGVLSGGRGYLNPIAFNYIQPRTVGLAISRTF